MVFNLKINKNQYKSYYLSMGVDYYLLLHWFLLIFIGFYCFLFWRSSIVWEFFSKKHWFSYMKNCIFLAGAWLVSCWAGRQLGCITLSEIVASWLVGLPLYIIFAMHIVCKTKRERGRETKGMETVPVQDPELLLTIYANNVQKEERER